MRIGFLLSVAVAAMSLSDAAMPAETNAPAADSDSGQLVEISVTARRVAEDVQTVPISVTALSGEELQALNAVTLQDVATSVPNLAISPGAASKNAAIISMRGMVQTDNLMSLDPTVGVYLDDVYLARTYSVLGDLLDVQSVEVLEGPQGTLYGRNTIGGAIKVTTVKPDPNAGYTGYVGAGAGNLSSKEFLAAINLPLIPGTLAVRYAGSFHKDDGYTNSYLVPNVNGFATSLTPIKRINTNDTNTYSHRVSIRWTPSNNVTVDLAGSIFKANDNGALNVNLPGDVQNYVFGNATPSVFSNSPQRQGNFYSALTDGVPFDRTVVKTLNSTLQWNILDTLTTKLILGYDQSSNDAKGNSSGEVLGASGLEFVEFNPELNQAQRQFSVEYQILGHALDSHLSYIFGLYYFQEKGSEDSIGSSTYVFDANSSFNFASDVENRSKSGFGSVEYSWTDAFRTHFGLRYTRDDKSLDGHARTAAAGFPGVCIYAPAPGITTSTTDGGPCSAPQNTKASYPTFEVGADYRLTPDTFLYAKVGDGDQSGGNQGRAVGGQSLQPFYPDKVVTEEVGVKSEIFDKHLRVNVSLYHTKFTNIQQSLIAFVNKNTTTVVANQGDANISGVEAASELRLGSHVTLEGNVGYTKFVYLNDPILRSPQNPSLTGEFATTYVQPTSLGALTGRLGYTYTGSYYLTGGQTITTPQNQIGGHGLLNGRLSLALNGGWDIALWAKNLTDKQYFTGGLISAYTPGLFWGIHSAYEGAPRTFGVEVRYSF